MAWQKPEEKSAPNATEEVTLYYEDYEDGDDDEDGGNW